MAACTDTSLSLRAIDFIFYMSQLSQQDGGQFTFILLIKNGNTISMSFTNVRAHS